jgi:hypothetical protein
MDGDDKADGICARCCQKPSQCPLWWVGKRIDNPFHLLFLSRCPVGLAGGTSAGLGCEQPSTWDCRFPVFPLLLRQPSSPRPLGGRGRGNLMMFLARFWRRLHTPVFGFSGVALGCLSQFCIPRGRSWLQRALGPTMIMSIIVDPLQGLAVLPRRGASRSDEWGILSGELATKPLKHGIFIGGLQFQACRSINDRRCLLLLRPPPRARHGLTIFIQHEEDCLRGRTLRGGVVWLAVVIGPGRASDRQGSCRVMPASFIQGLANLWPKRQVFRGMWTGGTSLPARDATSQTGMTAARIVPRVRDRTPGFENCRP